MTLPLISAIIPTFKRKDLIHRSVLSVLAQTYQPVEAVVAIDGVNDGTREVLEALGDPRIKVIETGANKGPAEARNRAVQAAQGKYVALLDDDDAWSTDKLDRQMQIVNDRGLAERPFLLSCRTELRSPSGTSVIVPTELYDDQRDFGEYIFDRKHPTSRPGFVASGTLLMPRELALRVPFPTDSAHEDLSWLLLVVTRDRVPMIMAEQAMFIYYLQPGTRNNTQPWTASLEWARKYRSYMSGKAFSGLLSTTTAWKAKQQAGFYALREVAAAMHSEGNAKFGHWMTLAGIAMLPLGAIDKWRAHRR
jgi:glycosyltransferase involved in cell wall biosynthesis